MLIFHGVPFKPYLVNDLIDFRLRQQKLDPGNAAEVEKMRATPAGKFALRMYEDFRYAKLGK